MKMRKTLSHNLLVSEVYNQLKFPVKVGTSVFYYWAAYIYKILSLLYIKIRFFRHKSYKHRIKPQDHLEGQKFSFLMLIYMIPEKPLLAYVGICDKRGKQFIKAPIPESLAAKWVFEIFKFIHFIFWASLLVLFPFSPWNT